MEYLGNVPKATLIQAQAERLADSKGDKQLRIELVADKNHRYALAYQAINDGHEHDFQYKLSNPIKKRYWVPLKIQADGEKEPRWVLVNKASLHKRFGLTYKEIDEGVDNGTLNALVERRADNIRNHYRKQPGGIYVNAAAEKLEDSEGSVKDRFNFFPQDPDNKYAVHYKAIEQPEKGDFPALNAVQSRFWVPYRADNGDGSYTWILLNKSSLRKRFEITDEELEGGVKNWNLSEVLDKKVLTIKGDYNDALNQKTSYVDISNKILNTTNAYAIRLKEKFTEFCKFKKTRTTEDKKKFGQELHQLRMEFAKEWEGIEPELRALSELESGRFKKIEQLVNKALEEIVRKVNKLIVGIEINEFPGIQMGKIYKDFKKLANDVDAPIQKLERKQYEQLSKEIIGYAESFRGYLQNRFALYKYQPFVNVEDYVEGIKKEFEALQKKIKGPFSEIKKLDSNRFKNAAFEALGKDGSLGRIELSLKDLSDELKRPDFSAKMDDILKICDDIISELDTPKMLNV